MPIKPTNKDLETRIFEVNTHNFEETALEVFRFQATHNPVYQRFLQLLHRKPTEVKQLQDIPFLPIELFKTQQIIARSHEASIIFKSSSTTGATPAQHFVADIAIYHQSLMQAFKQFYGSPQQYCILALLPHYLERGQSSLVYMCKVLMEASNHQNNGFYLNQLDQLRKVLIQNAQTKTPTIVFGVTYALLQLAEMGKLELSNSIFIETGGMKGKGKELIRAELHQKLGAAWPKAQIHSEYGMTELLSQSYAKEADHYHSPDWKKVLVRDISDPLHFVARGKSGALNIIDLANLYSCSFIASSDLGKINADGSFSIAGRMDNSDIRGCNLMIS